MVLILDGNSLHVAHDDARMKENGPFWVKIPDLGLDVIKCLEQVEKPLNELPSNISNMKGCRIY